MALAEPVDTFYKVNFKSGGDTTRDAFGKHIQEISRIYGYLRALDAEKVSASDVNGSIGNLNTALTNHINSTTPHPNWKPSISYKDLTDKPGLDDLSGTLTASKVKGKLTNATIDAGNVNGLTGIIDDRIPESGGDGITSSNIASKGYVKFKNGLIVQWGNTGTIFPKNDEQAKDVTFSTSFPNNCFTVQLTVRNQNAAASADLGAHLVSASKTGFQVMLQEMNGDFSAINTLSVDYIAIGN